MGLTPSSEMYLKTISTLGEERGAVRVQDIAAHLGVRMPSVSQAIRRLAEQSYVTHNRYGTVALTPRGERAARDVRTRHRVLEEFLTRVLHVSPTVAAQDACALEHVVSPITLRRLSEFLEFVRTCPLGAGDAIAHFEEFTRFRADGRACPECTLHKADALATQASAVTPTLVPAKPSRRRKLHA
jgi:DtxR family transcriptional regulator, Mn-dependent transcriptional regulator